eukprot:TRINITY_DN14323_c0_g1_i2.p1 TRINITY_DN14323_c0_g1~~TRINITY_DN14323_c0_g1_i2.p1  ORF type:complete len:116 (+),score=10.54 TRINITY_DN14323_c0_g1_i2:2-349(+)
MSRVRVTFMTLGANNYEGWPSYLSSFLFFSSSLKDLSDILIAMFNSSSGSNKNEVSVSESTFSALSKPSLSMFFCLKTLTTGNTTCENPSELLSSAGTILQPGSLSTCSVLKKNS